MSEASLKPSARRRPIWPKVPARFVAAMLAGHSALGLAFAALLYIVCLTGTIVVFSHELERWEHPEGYLTSEVAPATVQRALDNALASAEARHGGAHDVMINLPYPELPRFSVRFYDPHRDIDTTVLLAEDGTPGVPVSTPATDFLVLLHTDLHIPGSWGRFLVGLTGVTLLASLFSGMMSHPRIFRDAFTLRRGGSRRLEEADLHNRLSVWGLPFHLVVTLTGAILGLATLILSVLAFAAFDGDIERATAALSGPSIADDPAPAPPPAIGAVLEAERARMNGTITSLRIAHIGEKGQSITVQGETRDHLALVDLATLDAAGTRLAEPVILDGPFGHQLVAAFSALHYGWFGHGLVKLAYGILGLALTVIVSGGVTIFVERRRDQGRPVPFWARAWSAIVWGQVLAYAAVALAGLAGTQDGNTLLGVYLFFSLLPFAGVGINTEPLAFSRFWRGTAGAAVLLVPVMHVAMWAEASDDPMAWTVNASIGAIGLVLAGSALQPRKSVLRLAERLGQA